MLTKIKILIFGCLLALAMATVLVLRDTSTQGLVLSSYHTEDDVPSGVVPLFVYKVEEDENGDVIYWHKPEKILR